MKVELNRRLLPFEYFDFFERNQVSDESGLTVLSFWASNGIFSTSQTDIASFTAGADGNIAEWDIRFGENSGFDDDYSQSTSLMDRSSHRREYALEDGIGATFADASTYGPGTWSYVEGTAAAPDEIAAVPLPASVPLLATGFGILAFIRRRKATS
ncbi:VPLPA-CTERM sorting domain-containing protein [Palleronia sp. LCG004]|uniref:VPLPA-CTERM sorting domain-containing protein n=1 Tax=Palleronia sp. LCG004 TaxID=3079304 RepID=UPI0029433AE5|nr:VPLPA-CTERM sorting domain-containing protein [Palleronia sp. LCG004]WOI54938.1 VPLPA-CTERM sorting domain-containing protein [Palleronia sp. LCG004]